MPTAKETRTALSAKYGGGAVPVTKVVDGALADTDIAVPGIKVGDFIESVVAYDPDNATAALQVVEQSDNARVSSNGNIQVSQDTTGYDLVVRYWSL